MNALTNAATLFLAGALSFAIQPLVARMLLPRLGGAPTVWVVTLLFFQTALLVGYAYALALSRVRDLRAQALAHALVLIAAGVTLPPALRTVVLADPSATTLATLAATIGPAYVAIVATSPLVQQWLARSRASADPYVLYAASNGGSLLGLLAYPFLLEPLFGLSAQAVGWAVAYVVAAALVVSSGLIAAARARAVAGPGAVAWSPPRRSLGWIALAALPAAWLGAVTTHLTTAVAPIPLLWVIPLALYLLTLVIAFAPPALRGWLDRSLERGLALSDIEDASVVRRAAAPVSVAIAAVLLAMRVAEPIGPVMVVHLAALFFGALACHTRLADRRPPAAELTAYYLAVAVGGAMGGAFAGVIAPANFPTVLEYPTVLAAFVASGLAFGGWGWRGRRGIAAALGAIAIALLVASGAVHWFLVPIVLGVAAILALAASPAARLAGVALLIALVVSDSVPIVGGYRQLHAERSFFGVNRVLVSPDESQHVLLNGPVVHGAQLVDDPTAPMSYYTREGPLGDVLGTRAERVGVVGLGAGAIACYARSGSAIDFYEIDPDVVAIASDPRFFRYLRECPARRIVVGDARISLRSVGDGTYDVLVVDAYSGDAMPTHLLTREAFALYQRVLAPGGVIALHLSNTYFDLEPLIAALARDAGLVARIRDDTDPENEVAHVAAWSPSIWAVLGAEPDIRARVGSRSSWVPPRVREGLRAWTDDRADPLAIRR